MMGQHMAGEAITGEEAPPMSARRGGWGIYQIFATRDARNYSSASPATIIGALLRDFDRPDLLAIRARHQREARRSARISHPDRRRTPRRL